MKCCICEGEIAPVGDWIMGNSAEPVAEGRCCNDCDTNVVVPARLREHRRRVEAAEANHAEVVGKFVPWLDRQTEGG